jgi:uncharacterized protein YjbI with pentapeptide repeats
VWDGAVATDTSTYTIQDAAFNMVNASFRNMDMSKWEFGISSSKFQGVSMGYLTACPSFWVSTGWKCKLMRAAGTDYFAVGSNANLSATSVLAIESVEGSVLDIDADALDNVTLSGASFVGSTITNNFVNSSLYQADFSYSILRFAHWQNISSMSGIKFIGAKINNVIFEPGISIGGDFTNAELNNVKFIDDVVVSDFTGATLREVDFAMMSYSDFTSAALENVRIKSSQSAQASPFYTTFDKTRFYGTFYVGDHYGGYPDILHLIYKDVEFLGGTLKGDFHSVVFSGTVTFDQVLLDTLNLQYASIPLVDTTAPHDDLATVTWGSVTCPDGTTVTGGTGANSCDYSTRMNQ